MSDFYEICTDLGVSLAKKKSIGSSIFSGLEHLLRLINLKKTTVKILQGKITCISFSRSQLQIIAIQIKVVLKQLQELTDLINFCIRVIRAGRAFTRRLYDV